MSSWLRDGLEGRTFKDTLRLYLFGLTLLGIIAGFIALVDGTVAFLVTPLLVAALVFIEYDQIYFLRKKARDHPRVLGAPLESVGLMEDIDLALNCPKEDEKPHENLGVSGLVRPMRVFISHASTDKQMVRSLYNQLRSKGLTPWLDEEDLLPGMNWKIEIERAVRESDVVLVCLSQRALKRTGHLQKEIDVALEIANERAEKGTFLISVRFEECEVPVPLRDRESVNMFDDRGYRRLLHSLNARARELGLSTDSQI